jgi:CheY-like chemotaxis protein
MPGHILVVDDDPSIVRLLSLNLQMEGYEVTSASNGRDALAALAAAPIDLLVCDVMMPGMTGLELTAHLRKDAATKSLPIVLLSARAQRADIRHGLAAGADEYITKPFEPAELLATIDRILAARAKPGRARK